MTGKRIIFVQRLLSFLGLEERLHLAWISSAEAQCFVQEVTEFTERLMALGPSPIKEQGISLEASALSMRDNA
jgi:F420-non-reducing hydrogenase iron-sulfur subunit